jgi:hypothetical protein
MLAKNTEFIAKANTADRPAVDAAFSPEPAREHQRAEPAAARSANSDLGRGERAVLNDMLAPACSCSATYPQGYSLDTRNSAITRVRGTPDLVVLETLNHFATGSIAARWPASAAACRPACRARCPIPRSMFMTFAYSCAKLPELPMTPRKADARVGYFTSAVMDFSDDLARTPRQRFVNRWRLEKKDAAAALSEPVKPITFWLDRTIPEKYRAPITAGVLSGTRPSSASASGTRSASRCSRKTPTGTRSTSAVPRSAG